VAGTPFQPWLELWRLTPDGEPIHMPMSDSHLLPVRWNGQTAMLKISRAPEERRGGAVMAWWGGQGAARVFAYEGEALLMERAEGVRSLADMARGGQDDAATRILCGVLGELHSQDGRAPPPTAVPLPVWFQALEPGAAAHGGVLLKSLAAARELLAEPREIAVLHGDMHHANVLDFGARGWLAIDPKGLVGDRGFDHANMLCNPDIETSGAPGRLARQAQVAAQASGVAPERLLKWTLAYAGLSASWTLAGDGNAAPALQLAQIAAGELGL
jgi:streptomycin 6-kinase